MNKKRMFIFCFLISFVILAITSKSSFLYPFNDWGDANAFFTMGKGLMNGLIVFKDLFEQKGPLLYLIYGISYLISNTSFLGVFILEVLSSTIFLYITSKIINLYLEEKYNYLILPLYAFLIFTSISFRHGGSCEEFCFPFLSLTLYELLKYLKEDYISYKRIYLVGILAGLIFLIKYTLLGINFAFMLYLFLSLIIKKDYKKALISPCIYLLGMFTPIIPWLIYFGINHALKDFLNVYLLINLFSYTETKTNLFIKLFMCFYNFLRNILANKLVVLAFLSLIFPIVSKKVSNKEKIALLITLIFAILFIYIGGIYLIYYCLPIFIFLIFSLIYLVSFIKPKESIKKYTLYFIILIILTFVVSPNTYLLKEKKEDLVQYKFRDIIMKSKNPTILNYGELDMGFYTVTGIIPNTKYFEKLNFKYDKYPQNVDALNKYIKNKEIKYVIYVDDGKKDFPVSKDLGVTYQLIAKETQNLEGKTFKYYLYELK